MDEENSGVYVKICVSSWPLLEFVKSFPASQRLTLQKLTENDTRTLVTRRLQDNSRFGELQRRSEDEVRRCDKLLEKILTEAEGVFIWVVLVLSELEQALADSDSPEVLERIVATSYKEINDFIHSIVLSISRRYRLGSYYPLAVVLRMLNMFTSRPRRRPTCEPPWRVHSRCTKARMCITLALRRAPCSSTRPTLGTCWIVSKIWPRLR
jgi:hypothetical protein